MPWTDARILTEDKQMSTEVNALQAKREALHSPQPPRNDTSIFGKIAGKALNIVNRLLRGCFRPLVALVALLSLFLAPPAMAQSWSLIADLPPLINAQGNDFYLGRTRGMGAGSSHGKVFAFGGEGDWNGATWNGSYTLPITYSYNPSTNAWTRVANLTRRTRVSRLCYRR